MTRLDGTHRTAKQRSAGLLGLGILCMGHGIGYLIAPPQNGVLPYAVDLVSFGGRTLPYLGAAWLIIGLACLYNSIRHRPGWGAVSAAVAMTCVWTGSYLTAFLSGLFPIHPPPDSSRSYIAGSIYLGFTLLLLSTVPPRPVREDDVDEQAS